jgi:hypothetical protein
MKYKVYLSQYVTACVKVELEIESDKSLDDIQEEIYEATEDWSRLARFSPESQKFPGEYVKGSYKYDLDYEGESGGEIDVYVEEDEQSSDEA